MGAYSISLKISALLLISVLWKPAYGQDKCSLACKGSASSPDFLNGHQYKYGVEGTVSIYLTGAEKQETSVKLLGQVSVTSLGNCVNELTVQNLVISGPDGKKYESPAGLEKAVRFTLQDGRVGPEICAEEQDSHRSLNLKRAIITLLQTEQKSTSQVDIFGVCPTDISSSQEGGAVLVHRSRDLSRCAHREQGKTDIVSAIYNPTAEIKNTQVLQSIMHIESKVNKGVPEKVSASEEYLYKPFSVGENGARAKVHTKLTLTGKGKGGASSSHCTETRTIIFENPHGVAVQPNNLQSVLAAVKETAKSVKTEASSTSAGNFAQLVRILRATGKDELLKAYSQVKGNNIEKRVFLDGLLRAGTGYSVEASIEILKSKELNQLEQSLVFLSLGNAKHVSNEAVKSAASLLDIPNVPKEVYLGVGALAGSFCRDHYCHDSKSEGIKILSQKLAAKLQNCRPKSKVEEDYVVAALKGIRNIRHLEDSLIDKLTHCAADNGAKARVRVAALEAYHADPCAAKLKKSAIDIMKNRQLDSEIRIKAYLAVIECPCGQSANEIKNLLETEPVHQVGRFITSSLKHIRASANPDKRLARIHYGLIRTPNHFNVDDRKYSFYREVSYNVDALGVGGNAEQTVIFSQDSFVPRSASLNVTAELFGHSLNVFEIGGRQGNLDRVIEHFLGPKSFLRTKPPQEIYDDLVKRFEESRKKVDESFSRGRRSIKSEVDNFDKHLKDEAEPYNNELDLDLYVKLFGTDAVFLSLGDNKGIDFNNILDQLLKSVNTGISQIKNFHQEVRAHLLFLDAELAYPTSTGLPLKLDLVGSATGRLEASSSIDIRQCLKNPESAKIDIKLVPSTDIELAGLFVVDADAVTAGIKVVANLHSSTGGHLIAKVLDNGRGFDVQFGLPVDKQEIVSASNDLIYIVAEKGQKEKQTAIKIDTKRHEYSGRFDQLSKVIGLTLYGEVSVPFSVNGPEAESSVSKFLARYPLTGPSKVRVVVEKDDLNGYHMKGLIKRDPGHYGFELLFEAEGSNTRRTQLIGDIVSNKEEVSAKLVFDGNTFPQASAQIGLYDKANEYAVIGKAKLNNNDYYLRAGLNKAGDDKRMVYTPTLEYQLGTPQKENVKINGKLIRESSPPVTTYKIEGCQIKLREDEPINIAGFLKMDPNGIDFDVKLDQGAQKGFLNGAVKKQDLKVEFKNTLNPNINFKFDGNLQNDPNSRHISGDLHYGQDLSSNVNRVVLDHYHKYYSEGQDFNCITKNKFEIYGIPFKLKLDIDADAKKFILDAETKYTDKKAEFKVEARTQIKVPGDYSVKVFAGVDKNSVEVFSKRDIVSADKSNFENYVNIANFVKYELSGVVLHKTKKNDVNVGFVGHFKISHGSKSDNIAFDVGAIENPSLYSSHAKVSAQNVVYLDYLLKVTRGANPDGTLKFILKDTIAANGQFKVTDNDGKGNAMIIVDFKKSQRKFKGDVKFVVKDPVYNADVDIYLNFEKDNNDKIHFSTNTKKTDKLIDTKNKLEYAGKKTEVNVHSDITLDAGKTSSNFEVVLPTERCLNLKIDRAFTEKDGALSGHAEVVFSDAAKRGGAASKIVYKSKLSNTNVEKNLVDYEGELSLQLKDGKNLKNTVIVKNVLNNNKYKTDYKSDVTGNLIPKPASVVFSSETVDSDAIDTTYKFKAKYGDDLYTEVNGVWEVKLLEKGDKKYNDDFTVLVHLPIEQCHDIKWISTVLFTQPANSDVVDYTIIESLQVNADTYKVDASGKTGPKDGFGKVKLLAPHVDPVIFDVKYKSNLEGEKKYGNAELNAQYGKGKSAKIAVDASVAPQDYQLKFKAHAPQAEKFKKLEIDIRSKNPTPDTLNSVAIVDVDGRVYKSESLVVYSKSQPLIDIKYTGPESPKVQRIYLKGSSVSSTQGKVEAKIENVRDFNLDGEAEGSLQKEHVFLKAHFNSEKLGAKNYKVEISSKDAGNGKRLEFLASNDNKNILSGNTSFISKQEGPKTIIEGSGSVKVKEDQKSANFKYIRTVLTEGNEQGVETFVNVAIGDRSYVAESRVTNLEYKNSYVYCEEKKQCANAEIHSKVNVEKPGAFVHILNIGFDLRKLGIAPEFGLQVFNEVSENKLPQYKLDLHVNKEDKKYHLHVYSQPEYGKFPAGITVSLPSRVLALESVISYPKNKALPFPIHGEINLFMDKNKPQQKTSGRFLINFSEDATQEVGVAEFGFSHPKLGKEAVIKINGKFQHPKDNMIKLDTSVTFSHPPVGADRKFGLLFEASPTNIKLFASTPYVKVIDLQGSATVNEKLQKGDVTFSLLEGKAVVVRVEVKELKYFEFTTGYSDQSERKLSIIGHIKPEERVDVSMDIVLPGEKKNIIHGALFVQDNLVKSDYGISKENFNYFVNALKNDLSALGKRVQELEGKSEAVIKDTLHKMEPYFKKLQQAYSEDIEKLYHEIANDQTLKEISHALSSIVHFLAAIIDDFIKATAPFVDTLNKYVVETGKKIEELYVKQIQPPLKQLYGNIAAIIKEYFDGLIDIVAHFAALITDFFEKHKPELQELTDTVTEIFKDLTRLLVAKLKEFQAKASVVFEDIIRQIKEMPIFAMIKEKINEVNVPEQVINIITTAHEFIRDVLPTQEAKQFATAVFNYSVKKLRREKCDDGKELRVIYEKFAAALTSVVHHIKTGFNLPNFYNVNYLPLISYPSQVSAPSLGGSASLSLLNQLLTGDVPDPVKLLQAYRPRSLNPLDEVPAKLRAVVVNGQHIFTFDNRHLTFPGNCRYVLAHDYVDRNFTLVMQLQNGAPKVLALEDKSGTTIELKENGQVVLNGAVHGFPVIEEDVFAFRQTNGRVGLGSKYGLMAFCTAKLTVCYIEVNGFYHGKLRGLLGDGNHEPFDDFRLPNGKISTSEAEFGNSYRLAGSCPQVKTPEHNHHQHHAALPPACEKVFGATSPLRPLALVLDVTPFRQACIHACAGDSAGDLEQACDLARGYTALAVSGLLPAVLPDVCVQCTDADKPKNVGDSYELKLPNKQADIVINVETTKSNEQQFKDLVVPLVSQLVDSLKSKRFADIKVYLVGITPKYPYPIVYDTDIKLKQPKVKFDDESRYPDIKTINTGYPKLDELQNAIADIYEVLTDKLGIGNVAASYMSVLELPLRPGAVKHTINVVGERCRPQFFLVEALRSAIFDTAFEENAYTHSIVAPTPDLKCGGGKNPSQIVGITEKAVIFLGEKKLSKDAEQIRSTVNLPDDVCLNFIQQTSGMIVSSTNYKNLNNGQKKQFLQTAANAIVHKMTKETLVQDCTCGYVDPFRVRSICFNKQRKEAARRRK